MFELQEVTAVIVNFKTADLTRQAVSSFRDFYPVMQLLLIDNGSHDESTALLQGLRNQSPDITCLILNDRNIHHGPAMDQALRAVQSKYVLFLDSDCEVIRGGFIQAMVALSEQQLQHYAVGQKVLMNSRGFDVPPSREVFEYLRPICMLVKRETYLTFPAFEKHGTPCLKNFRFAISKGYHLVDFPVLEYVHHKGRGTSSQHGYRLGLRGKWNHLMHKLGL